MDFVYSVSYPHMERRGHRRRALTRKETYAMELVLQWLLFICGDDDPIIAAPRSGG